MARRKWTKEEIEDYRKIHGALFYCNREDSNFFVPKAFGIGMTLNFANPISWALILIVIAIAVFRMFFK